MVDTTRAAKIEEMLHQIRVTATAALDLPPDPQPVSKRQPFQEPVLYHLDDGIVIPAIRYDTWFDGGSLLILDLNHPNAKSVIGKPEWFDADYIAQYNGLVPECCNEGTEPGEWSRGRMPKPDPQPAMPGAEALRELRDWARRGYEEWTEMAKKDPRDRAFACLPYHYSAFMSEIDRAAAKVQEPAPPHKKDCCRPRWRYSGGGYNRVRICACGAEVHDPELPQEPAVDRGELRDEIHKHLWALSQDLDDDMGRKETEERVNVAVADILALLPAQGDEDARLRNQVADMHANWQRQIAMHEETRARLAAAEKVVEAARPISTPGTTLTMWDTLRKSLAVYDAAKEGKR